MAIVFLDADVIICAQWRLISAQYPGQLCIIATTNIKHISRFAIAEEKQSQLITLPRRGSHSHPTAPVAASKYIASTLTMTRF